MTFLRTVEYPYLYRFIFGMYSLSELTQSTLLLQNEVVGRVRAVYAVYYI